jgi:four helix bundle protein
LDNRNTETGKWKLEKKYGILQIKFSLKIKNVIEKFEDLNIWKESVELSVILYKQLRNCKDYALRDQMQRSAVSIPSNIAEGFERTNKEFIRFLNIAKGSCSELRTQLTIAKEIEILQKDEANLHIETTRKLSAMLSKLISTRQNNFK